MIHDYKLQPGQRVISGLGSLDRLPDVLQSLGRSRAVIMTGNTLATKTDLVEQVKSALGELHAGTFAACKQHVPSETVDAALAFAKEAEADCLVSFGGGSPIDTAKIVAHRILEKSPREKFPQVAIPTTLSAGEYTGSAGMTDTKKRTKGGMRSWNVVPAAVILDPNVTTATPTQLWAATGMKAVDHAVEALWSPRAHPITDLLASEALTKLNAHLAASLDPKAMAARMECQFAAWMSIFGVTTAGMRLTHPMGHQIGARWNVPHGVTSCITLPTIARFLKPTTEAAQQKIATTLGASDAAIGLEALLDSLPVPRTLSELGVPREELRDCAEAISRELRRAGSPDAETATEDVLLALLEEMY
jgi:alcohol dehydrogenase